MGERGIVMMMTGELEKGSDEPTSKHLKVNLKKKNLEAMMIIIYLVKGDLNPSE